MPEEVSLAEAPFRQEKSVLRLSEQEMAVLAALTDARGRVVGRAELQRRSGLSDRAPRRCDSLIVGLRRVLGPEAIVTVRGRGWRCPPDIAPLDDAASGSL